MTTTPDPVTMTTLLDELRSAVLELSATAQKRGAEVALAGVVGHSDSVRAAQDAHDAAEDRVSHLLVRASVLAAGVRL